MHCVCASGRDSDWLGRDEREGSLLGRLRERAGVWRELGASRFVMKVIEEGFSLPFVQSSTKTVMANHGSCRVHAGFVSEAISDLVQTNCARRVGKEEVHMCSPLGVHDKGRKLRLILDLRYVYEHLARYRFKYEDMQLAEQLF